MLAAELAPWIENPRVASGVAILLILVGCLVAGSLVARLLSDVWKWTGLRWMDMLLGAAFGVVRGALVSGFVLLGLLAFQPFDSTPRIVAESRIAPWVINVARTVASLAPEALRDAFRRGVEAVEEENSVDRG